MPVVDPWLPPVPIPVSRKMIALAVYKFNDPTDATAGFTLLSNLRCLKIAREIGPDPGTAMLRYVFDGSDTDAPQSIEEAISPNNTLTKTVQITDRLGVKATKPDGSADWIFDGYPVDWSIQLKNKVEVCYIKLVGVAKREFDTTTGGALMRDADAPTTVSDVPTDQPANFNPKGEPNATPAGSEAGTAPKKYATFLDPLVIRSPDVRAKWTLAMAARHLFFVNNKNETYVKNPLGTDMDSMLVARVPIAGTGFDPNNATTYTTKQITVPDTPLKGRDYPSLAFDIIRDYGFGMFPKLSTDGSGNPKTTWYLFPNQSGPIKQLVLQARGATLDPKLSNVSELAIGREIEDVANAWEVHGAPKRYEATFILAPGFAMTNTDGATLSNLANYDKSDPAYSVANHDKYRLYVFDETGEGHYPMGSTTVDNTVASLDAVLGAPVGGAVQYVRRRRDPQSRLLTTDANNKPLNVQVSVSKDYAGTRPSVWDGSGTWQKVEGGFELLEDRIGIRLNCDNPNKWRIGDSNQASHPYQLGEVKGVEDQCTAGATNFTVRLTCVIEADHRVKGKAAKQASNQLTQTITRIIDAGDRYRLDTITAGSELNAGVALVERDDTDDATSEAVAARWTTENGLLSGTVRIPRFTRYYELGDRIDKLEGRTINFQTNYGTSNTDAPIYPIVARIEHSFDGEQATYLTLSDSATNRTNFKRAARTKHERL